MNLAPAAFFAGMVSFITPCVLPLVPAYLSAIGARGAEPRAAIRAGIPFVLGFSAVFIALGVGAALLGGRFVDYRTSLIHLGGILIVAMGFVMMGVLNIPVLERSLQPAVQPARLSGSSLLLGGAFGLCWTPCVGPGAGIAPAAGRLEPHGRVGRRAPGLLLAGPGDPVPAGGRGVRQGDVGRAHHARPLHGIRAVSGVLLVLVGLAMFFDRMWVVNSLVDQVVQAA